MVKRPGKVMPTDTSAIPVPTTKRTLRAGATVRMDFSIDTVCVDCGQQTNRFVDDVPLHRLCEAKRSAGE